MALKLFTGFELPGSAIHEAEMLIKKTDSSIHWTPINNLHLTAYFFGKWEEEALANLQSCITLAIKNQPRFTLKLDDIILAPQGHEPRMIWAKYKKNTAFLTLTNTLRTMFLALDPEHQVRKNPIPHITLARLQNWQKDREIEVDTRSKLWELPCKELVLWKSVPEASGTRYHEVGRWKL